MGKGACGAARHLIGCAIFLVIIGPVLIIVGIVLLVSKNTREEDIKRYNAAIEDYSKYTNSIDMWSGSAYQDLSLSIANLSATTQQVVVDGNQDGVNTAVSHLAEGSLSTFKTTGAVNFQTNFGTFSRAFPMTKTKDEDIRCSSRSCSDYCYDSSDRECNDDSRLEQECQRLYNNQARFVRTKSWCEGNDKCGYCKYDAYPSRLCAVADQEIEGEASPSTTKMSCDYPFTLDAGEYTATRPAFNALTSTYTPANRVVVQIRSAHDPYIELQEITEGSNDFGLTRGQQTTYGFACLFIGIAITLGLCALLFYITKNQNQQDDYNRNNEMVVVQQQQQPQQQQAYPQAQPVQQVYPVQEVQPVYGQPAQGAYPPAQGYDQNQQQPGSVQQQQQPMYGSQNNGAYPQKSV